jgi:short-subunit dehydrogenase
VNLIVGGTHGLGGEIAHVLQEKGEETFVIGRSYDEATHGMGAALDLSNDTDVQTFVENLPNLDVTGFYWVAGYGYNGDFSEQPNPRKMAAVNFANVMPIAQAIWQKLLQSDLASHYVIISSTTGIKARKDEAVYAATKHAQVGFGRSLGLESERLTANIRIGLFLPGGMRTEFWEDNEPANFEEFLDPAVVAKRIVERTSNQTNYFYEETIERGTL